MRTTEDLFQKRAPRLHHHPRHRGRERPPLPRRLLQAAKAKTLPKPGEALAKKAVIEAILAKHDAATGGRRFNALLATASINDAIEYHGLFKTMQAEKQAADPDFEPLNIACVFSPPAEGDADVKQIQEDLPQEKEDNEDEPEKQEGRPQGHPRRLQRPLRHQPHASASSISTIRTCRSASRTSSGPTPTCPATAQKIDITIVVDMLLTGFDSKYLNTLYVDKNLKHHGLIQAFSRTNRVLNGTKPYGNILDFRQQQDAVDAAIALFSGEKTGEQAREIWLVDKAPVVIQKLEAAVQKLDAFMKSQGLDCTPGGRAQPQGRRRPRRLHQALQGSPAPQDPARPIHRPHRRKTKPAIEQVLPEENLRGFRGAYLETAQRLKDQQGKGGDKPGPTTPWTSSTSSSSSSPPPSLITTTSWASSPASPSRRRASRR